MAKKIDVKNIFKGRKSASPQQIGLKTLVWLGFNYTCSMGFTLTLSNTFGGETGVGIHLFWIIILGAVVAGGAAWAFAKCAGVYSDQNGGAFEYSRRTFGRFNGWMVGFYQYVLIPVTTPASILVVIVVAFEGMYDPLMWGTVEQTQLYLSLISIGIYIFLSLLVLLGTVVFKWATNITSVFKWVMLFMVYVAAVIIMIDTSGSNFEEGLGAGELNPSNFNSSFSAFFYAYTGFETFAAVGQNVKNPKKTMPKAIMLVLLVAVIFYMVGLVFVMGALGGAIPDNPNNAIVELGLGAGALVMVGISNISANINGFMQGAFYSGGMLQPLSEQKMITTKVSVINKNGIAIKALFLNMSLTVFFAFFWLVLPYILGDSSIDYTSLVGFNSIVMFIVYGYVMMAALVLSWKKKTSSNILVYVLWIGVICFLGYQCVAYFMEWDTNKWQILTFSVVTLIAVGWYFLGATLNQKVKFYNWKLDSLNKQISKVDNEEKKEKLQAKIDYIKEQLDWVLESIKKGKESFDDLPNWEDTVEYKEIIDYKMSKLNVKQRSLTDGSSSMLTPKFVLLKQLSKNTKIALKQNDQLEFKQLETSLMTKKEIINKIDKVKESL